MTPFRDRIRSLSAPWLQDGTGERLSYPAGLATDAVVEAATQGTLAHMPTRGTADALPIIGADRGPITRGPNESDAGYRARLQRAPGDWARWGSPFGINEQVAAYFLPALPKVQIVTDSGHWYTTQPTPSGNQETVLPPTARPPAAASNWDWDALAGTDWWRFWLIVDGTALATTTPLWGAPGLRWGAPGLTWGGLPHGMGDDIRAIVQAWMPEHSFCQNIIFDYFGHFLPTGSGAGYPAGNWDLWANRYQPAAYLDGVGPD